MTPRGGKREGAGRKKVLKDAVDVTVRLSAWQLADVKAWQEKHKIGSVAAAIRMMLVAARAEWEEQHGEYLTPPR